MMKGGHTFWFVPDSDDTMDIRFYAQEEDAKRRAVTFNGAGFFISDDGIIVTSDRIAAPTVNTGDVCRALAGQLSYLKRYYTAQRDLYSQRLELVADGFQTLARERLESMPYVRNNVQMRADLEREYIQRKNKLADMQAVFRHKVDSLGDVLKELDAFNNSQVSIYPVQQLRVAFCLGLGKGWSSYQSSNLLVSDHRQGMAVIQLISRQTPESSAVFELPSEGWNLSGLFKKHESKQLYIIGLQGNYNKPAGVQSRIVSSDRVEGRDGHTLTLDNTGGNLLPGSPVVDTDGTLVGVCTGESGSAFASKIENLFKIVRIKIQ